MERKLVYSGKSKDVYEEGNDYLLVFKDEITGTEAGFDPGSDTVIGKIEGMGKLSCAFTCFFFDLLNKEGIPNHFIKKVDVDKILVRPARIIGAEHRQKGLLGFEFVYRNNACGSFLRRYPFIPPFSEFEEVLLEITTKGKSDVLVVPEAMIQMRLLNRQQLSRALQLTRDVNKILTRTFKEKGLRLLDGKIEIGIIDEEVVVIDDISPGNVRVCRQDAYKKFLSSKELPEPLDPRKTYKFFFS